MRLHRFFVEDTPLRNDKLVITDTNLLHQWKKVFRLGAGDTVVLFDGSQYEYAFVISLLSQEKAELLLQESRTIRPLGREVWLCAALIKKDNFEWIVQKATELGVAHIIPLHAGRSEKKELNHDRLKKIAIEASEQSGRGAVPVIHEVCTIDRALSRMVGIEKVVFEPAGIALIQSDFAQKKPVAFFVGPEGGWTDEELALFEREKIRVKTLGEQILRAETAAVAGAALFLLQ